MSWPSPQDYNEAVQNPRFSFSDEELRSCQAELNHLGLPVAITGGFASVYRMSNRRNTWAVRCFLEQRPTQEERYEEIARYVMFDSLDCTVHFEYLKSGIMIRGDWYPILKMQWVPGETLDAYINKHVHDKTRMEALLTAFTDMARQLNEAGIAHGDLQHGNIMVVADELRLVDYDGMYVPNLEGLHAIELGHRNYQHPLRDSLHFGPYLDNFSLWLIEASLTCITIEPRLWRLVPGGDECLLFRREDLYNPDSSEIFKIIEYHPIEQIRALAQQIRHLLAIPPDAIPSLGEALPTTFTQAPRRVIIDAEKPSLKKPPARTGAPDWTLYLDPDSESSVRLNEGVFGSIARNLSKAGQSVAEKMMTSVAPRLAAADLRKRAGALVLRGEYANAATLFDKAVEILKRTDTTPGGLFLSCMLGLGYSHMLNKNLGIAAHYFKQALDYSSGDYWEHKVAALSLAAAYFGQGRKGDALSLLTKNFQSPELFLPSIIKSDLLPVVRCTEIGDVILAWAEEFPSNDTASEITLTDEQLCGVYEAAIEAFERCHEASSTRVTEQLNKATVLLGLSYCRNEYFFSARRCFQKAIDSKCHNSWTARAVFYQAAVLYEQGEITEAFALLDNSLKPTELKYVLDSELRLTYKRRLSIAHMLHDLAISHEERSNNEAPLNESIALGSGQGKRERTDLPKILCKKALDIYRALSAADSSAEIADCLFVLGKPVDALRTLENLQATPGALWDRLTKRQLDYASRMVEKGELEEALLVFQRCEGARSTRSAQLEAELKRRQLTFAHELKRQGHLDAAFTLFERWEGPGGPNVLQIKSQQCDIAYQKARILEQQGHLDEALFLASKFEDVSPGYPQHLQEAIRMRDLATAETLRENGRYEETMALLTKHKDVFEKEIKALRRQMIDRDIETARKLVREGNLSEAILILEPLQAQSPKAASELQLYLSQIDAESLADLPNLRADQFVAHQLVQERKFRQALETLERHEDSGHGAAIIREQWALRCFEVAMGSQLVFDGYAFKTGIDLLEELDMSGNLTKKLISDVTDLIVSFKGAYTREIEGYLKEFLDLILRIQGREAEEARKMREYLQFRMLHPH